MGDQRRSFPRFKRTAEAPRVALTADDVEILRRIYRYRFLRADHLYRLFPDRSPDRLSRRMTLLYRNHYLDRPIAQVDRFREGGSRALVYGLDNAGARFLAEADGLSLASGEWKARNRSYTRENLDHTLAITQFLVDLELACRSRREVELLPFDEVLRGAPAETRQRAQPGRWSVPLQWNGLSGSVVVVPDAIFGLKRSKAEGQTVRTFAFLEVDRGTMTIAPAAHVRESDAFLHRATILRKLLAYAESHRLGLHAARFGFPIARVLILTTTPARAEAMRIACERHIVRPLSLPTGLFLFGAAATDGDPLGACWRDVAGQPVSLLPGTA